MKDQLQETVAKYVCGFLNSQVEGKLMLGVSDKGISTVKSHIIQHVCNY